MCWIALVFPLYNKTFFKPWFFRLVFSPVLLRRLHSSSDSLCKNLNFKQNRMKFFSKTIFSFRLLLSLFLLMVQMGKCLFWQFQSLLMTLHSFFTLTCTPPLLAFIQFPFSAICWLFALEGLAIFEIHTNAIWRKYGYNEHQTILNETFCVFFCHSHQAHSSSFRGIT